MLYTLMISLTRNKKLSYLTVSTEGQKRFSKLPDATYLQGATEYTKALLKLEKEYKSVKNKRAERYVFRKRAQLQAKVFQNMLLRYVILPRRAISTTF